MDPNLRPTPETDSAEAAFVADWNRHREAGWPSAAAVTRGFDTARRLERERDEAREQSDAIYRALSDLKENLALVIPALEAASGLKADDFRANCPDGGMSQNEWAALWLARSIVERQGAS